MWVDDGGTAVSCQMRNARKICHRRLLRNYYVLFNYEVVYSGTGVSANANNLLAVQMGSNGKYS